MLPPQSPVQVATASVLLREGAESGEQVGHTVGLLDHLIRPLQERRRDRQAERLRGLEVDAELERRHLSDGCLAGLRPPQNLVDGLSQQTVEFTDVVAVPSAPGAAGVRVWEVMSRERGPRTGRPPPEAFMSTILCAIPSTSRIFPTLCAGNSRPGRGVSAGR